MTRKMFSHIPETDKELAKQLVKLQKDVDSACKIELQSKKMMVCNVSCACGKLTGLAMLIVKDLKPQLSWGIMTGQFYLATKGIHKNDLLCTECDKPALTKGDWRTE